MALLQIAEPGRAAAPHQHRLAVGIDLGTTNSLVATVRSGLPTVLADADGRQLLPSVVHYGADGVLRVGDAARAFALTDPQNTVASAKRLIGRALADLAPGTVPYTLAAMGPSAVGVCTRAGLKSPVDIGAEVLQVLKDRAEAALGGELVGAVITVPAYFDDAQRQATKDAATRAGLHVLRLLNEPTAAAVAYGLESASEGVYAVYDLGGGTFDVSILRLSRGVFEVVATAGDAMLGGDDFDHALAAWFADATGGWQRSDMAALHAAARRAKEALTDAPGVVMACARADGGTSSVRLDRATFDQLTAALVARTLAPVKQALRDARLKPADIDGVFVGHFNGGFVRQDFSGALAALAPLAAFLAAFLAALCGVPAMAAVITVAPGQSLSGALARAADGDEVHLLAGVHRAQVGVIVQRRLTLRGDAALLSAAQVSSRRRAASAQRCCAAASSWPRRCSTIASRRAPRRSRSSNGTSGGNSTGGCSSACTAGPCSCAPSPASAGISFTVDVVGATFALVAAGAGPLHCARPPPPAASAPARLRCRSRHRRAWPGSPPGWRRVRPSAGRSR